MGYIDAKKMYGTDSKKIHKLDRHGSGNTNSPPSNKLLPPVWMKNQTPEKEVPRVLARDYRPPRAAEPRVPRTRGKRRTMRPRRRSALASPREAPHQRSAARITKHQSKERATTHHLCERAS